MRIIKAKDYDDMSRKAARVLAAQIIGKPNSVIGLATGSSPIGLYKELIAEYERGYLDFSGVRSINLDEYKGLSRDNDQSYYYFMNENLFSRINICKSNIHIPDGLNKDSEAECKRYDAIIEGLGGTDIQLLGLGGNGHIGFNEPDDVFKSGTHCVALQQSTIDANARFFDSIDDVPKNAYTMGIRGIMTSKKVLLIVSGKSKAEILNAALFGPVTPKVPASVLQLHGDVTVVSDCI